jgi:hypothetical protein
MAMLNYQRVESEFVTFSGDSILHRRLVYARGHSSTGKTWAPKAFDNLHLAMGPFHGTVVDIKMAGNWMFNDVHSFP